MHDNVTGEVPFQFLLGRSWLSLINEHFPPSLGEGGLSPGDLLE